MYAFFTVIAGCAAPVERAEDVADDPYARPVTDDPDAEVVLVFPTRSDEELDAQWQALRPWIEARGEAGRAVAAVGLHHVPGGTADDVRAHLAATFSDAGGRHLGLLGLPSTSADPDATLPAVPRFALPIAGADEAVPTDMPYGDPSAPLSDGAETSFGAFEVAEPTFLVFRVPVSDVEDLAVFAERSLAFEEADYRGDALLVAGSVAAAGDTTAIQCNVEDALDDADHSGEVLKVFDTDDCRPDVLLVEGGERLPDVLASDAWRGGFVYNISHGSGEATYFLGADGSLHDALTVEDALPGDKLNVFLSLACSADADLEDRWNLNRVLYESGSVATVTATVPTSYVGVDDVVRVETEALPTVLAGDGTLLEGFAEVRARYVEAVKGYDEDHAARAWSNLLSLNVTGDGTIRVGD